MATFESMQQQLRVIVEAELQVVKPGDVRAADLNTEFGKALLKQCFVHSHEDDEVQAPGHAVSDQVCARQEDADKFAEFFPTLWRGTGPVLEEGRACSSVFVQGSVFQAGEGRAGCFSCSLCRLSFQPRCRQVNFAMSARQGAVGLNLVEIGQPLSTELAT